MSDNVLWIHDPQALTVCDEYVYALRNTLGDINARLRSQAAELATIPTAAPSLAIPALPPVDLGPALHALGAVVEDLEWLGQALHTYAQATAEHERARALVWSEPAERALALWVSLSTGFSSDEVWGEDPVGHAARALGEHIPRHHSVTIREHGDETVVTQAPRTWGERVSRIPDTDVPIRIERYPDGRGQWSSEVYIAGTHEWSIGGTEEPFDMESNIAVVAGLPAASLVSVHRAMAQAGIKPGERVTFTGHSQGGIIAARLAESGRYRTTGLLVVGSPTGTLSVKGDYPAIALRHSDDVVPRLGGSDRGSGFVTIERDSGSGVGNIPGAHERAGYVDMARDIDSSPARPHLPDLPRAEGVAQVRTFSAVRGTG